MTKTAEEIREAINTLCVAGYYVIPREKLTQVCGQQTVDDVTLARAVDHDSLMNHVYRRIFADMAQELALPGIAELHSFRMKENYGTTFRATVTLLPFSVATDPMLEIMREEQSRARRV